MSAESSLIQLGIAVGLRSGRNYLIKTCITRVRFAVDAFVNFAR